MSSEECSEETSLLILMDWRGRCGPEKSRQHWLVMAGPAGQDSGRVDGDVGAEGLW